MSCLIRNFICFIIFSFWLMGPATSFARISSALEWSYGHFEAKESGVKIDDSSSFTQKYTLLYNTSGQFINGRGGRYDFSLGGEWVSLDTEIKRATETEIDIEESKFLYLGDITFAPGGLPFKVNIYSRDMHQTRFEEDVIFFREGSFDRETISDFRQNVLSPQIVDDLTDGEYVQSGASVVLGIRNGSYLGRYRNVLSRLPKLFFDYRETYVRDLESLSPEHYKERELAFVSLNKKHNWIHYRLYEHIDELFPADDYSEEKIILGTIDQYLRREWVNLTNWIQVSADGSFTKEKNPRNILGDENYYNLNFFTKTSRSNWKSTMLSRFFRHEKTDELVRSLQIPYFADGVFSRKTSWRARFLIDREVRNRPFELVNQEFSEDTVYARTKLYFNKRSNFQFSPLLEAENKQDTIIGDGSAIRGGVEFFSNKELARKFEIYLNANFAYFNGKPESALFEEVDFWESELDFDFEKQINPNFRNGVESSFLIGRGTLKRNLTDHITPASFKGLYANNILNTSEILDEVYRADLLWFGDYQSTGQLKNRFEVGVNYLDIDQTDQIQKFLLYRVDYNSRNIRANSNNYLVEGDNIKIALLSSSTVNAQLSSNVTGVAFSSFGGLRYAPSRKWELVSEYAFDYLEPDSSDLGGYKYEIKQSWRYLGFSHFGKFRRLYDFKEFFEYEAVELDSGFSSEIALLGAFVNYYPTSWSRLGAKYRMQHNIGGDYYDQGCGFYADMSFSKLHVGLEYEIGMRTDDDLGLVMDRDEERWQVKVKKTF